VRATQHRESGSATLARFIGGGGQTLRAARDDIGKAEPARLARRLAALVYDLMLLAAVLFMFTLAVFIIRGGRAVAPGTLWFQLSLAAIVVLFFTGFWVNGGQTLGMRAWRLRVVGVHGDRVRWPAALTRFAAGALALLPAGLGFWYAAFDVERRAWHDRLSGTRVLHEPKAATENGRAIGDARTRRP
jgi:uncharacterized RDD family membrane protein YckC